MSKSFEKFVGKYITISVKFFAEGSSREEYIQGILVSSEKDILTIEQCIPFSNLFIEKAKIIRIERKIHLNSTSQKTIKFF